MSYAFRLDQIRFRFKHQKRLKYLGIPASSMMFTTLQKLNRYNPVFLYLCGSLFHALDLTIHLQKCILELKYDHISEKGHSYTFYHFVSL